MQRRQFLPVMNCILVSCYNSLCVLRQVSASNLDHRHYVETEVLYLTSVWYYSGCGVSDTARSI